MNEESRIGCALSRLLILPRWTSRFIVLALFGCFAHAELFPRPPFEPDPKQIECLQRSITLLQSGTPENRPTFRILFYGQSYTLSDWWKYLSEDLKKTYPNVNFVITNKAVPAFQALALSYASRNDIGPWQPDLIFIHCLGANLDDYERLYSNFRSLTTADVIVQADHPITAEEIEEPSEVEDGTPGSVWLYRNYLWLPDLARKYGHCWADIRTPWKNYVISNNTTVKTLLGADFAHFNEDGNRFQTELLAKFLKPRVFEKPMDPWNNDRIQTKWVGKDIHWVNGSLDLKVVGNRVDAIYDPESPQDSPSFRVTIDDKKPSEFPSLYGFDRVSFTAGIGWPAVMLVDSAAPLLDETWTLKMDSLDEANYETFYTIVGSKTGPDGSGRSLQHFRSNSGRVVIAAGQVTIANAFGFTRFKPPENFEATWNAVGRFRETFQPIRASEPGLESSQTLFLGLPQTEHRLKITTIAGTPSRIRGLRVYSPNGLAQLKDRTSVVPVNGSFVGRRQGNDMVFTWPTEWGKGVVEFRARFNDGAPWSELSSEITLSGKSYQTKRVLTNSEGYFRWRP